MNANSATTSRADVPSSEFSAGRSRPSSRATSCGSRPSVEPASAPPPYGETAARADQSRRRSRSRTSGQRVGLQVVREQDRLRVLQVRAAGHDRVRVRLGLRDDARRRRAGCRARSCASGRAGTSARAWRSGRCGCARRAACRRARARRRAMSACSSAPCTSSSCGPGRSVPSVMPRASTSRPVVHRPLLVGGEIAGRGERLRVRVRAGDVVEREVPVEVGGAAQRRELRRRPGRESGAPQCAFVGAVALRMSLIRSSLSERVARLVRAVQ